MFCNAGENRFLQNVILKNSNKDAVIEFCNLAGVGAQNHRKKVKNEMAN